MLTAFATDTCKSTGSQVECRQNKVLAFCLFKYFPHGGLQRDMLAIALTCQRKGYVIDVYTTSWEGEIPPKFRLHLYRPIAPTNHGRMRQYHAWLTRQLTANPPSCVVGFNKMPDLDIYYAADGCYKALALQYNRVYRLNPRYRWYQKFEEAVFGQRSKTHILMLSEIQKALYVQHYGTPENRIHFLPPNVARDRIATSNAPKIRKVMRQTLGLGENDRFLLQLGSGFRTKGLNRSIIALAHLPDTLLAKTWLYVVGEDSKRPYQRLARRLGVADRVIFLGARSDVPQILIAADLLAHPARYENTGTVLLESLASGLPVVTTSVCGYAHYIEQAKAGWVIPAPFSQNMFNHTIQLALENPELGDYGRRGAQFAQRSDLYSMTDNAVTVIEMVALNHSI